MVPEQVWERHYPLVNSHSNEKSQPFVGKLTNYLVGGLKPSEKY